MSLTTISGEIQAQPLNDNFSFLNEKINNMSIVVNVKDDAYGAKGDGVTDDTTAINAAIAALGANGGNIYFPVGTYIISSTIELRDKRNIRFIGPGAGVNMNPAAVLKYTGTDARGMFDVVSGFYIMFENLTLMLANSGIDQLVRFQADDPTKTSSLSCGFRNCSLTGSSDLYPVKALLHMFNALNCFAENCWFSQSPIALILGENTADQTGIAGGSCGPAKIDNCCFQGDVLARRAGPLVFSNCNFLEKYHPTTLTESSSFYQEGDAFLGAVSFLGCNLNGLYNTAVTNTAISLANVEGFNICGNNFASYLTGVNISGSMTAGVITGNRFDLYFASASGTGINVVAGTAGNGLQLQPNHMHQHMISAGAKLINDDRTGSVGEFNVNAELTANFTLPATGSYQEITGLTTGTRVYGGYVKVRYAVTISAVDASEYKIQITIDGTPIKAGVKKEIAAGKTETITFEKALNLDCAGTWFRLLVCQVTGTSSATVVASNATNSTETFLQVEGMH